MFRTSVYVFLLVLKLDSQPTSEEQPCVLLTSPTIVPFQHQLTFQCRKQLDSNRIWRQARFASGLLERAWRIEVHAQVEFQIVPREALASHWRADSSTWIVAWCRHKRKENHQYVVCCENKFPRNILASVRNKMGQIFLLFIMLRAGLRSRFRKESGFLGEVGILRTLGVGVGFFYPTPTPEFQLNHLLHRTHKLGLLTRACLLKRYNFLLKLIETD